MAEKVLIVDDDVQTLRLVGLMLERQGYRILAANTGAQAIHMAHAEHPDIIVLDVMMPDFDGYEVSRRLRKDPETTNIPILMFTAKTQVDDKVTGYEAGADDYLTKPIHPAELTAHLRALLSRSKSRSAPAKERGYVIGVLAAKGGLGVSTLTLNLALAFHQKTKADVIAAELRPGLGTWSGELGNTVSDGLNHLLHMKPTEISAGTVEKELTRLSYGIRLLMASPRMRDIELMQANEQMEAILENLPLLAKLVMLDIGTPYMPAIDSVLNACNELIVVAEPYPAAVQRTRQLLEELTAKGFGRAKLLQVVSINRIRADVQLSLIQMQEMLGTNISQVFPPAPEIAFQAATRNVPFLQVQIGSAVSQQYHGLAERLAQRVLA
jgi:CheY-like chemotaxis protein/MinD-like ATPase involved in chromosome partitioning or flagellar assembly